MRYETIKPELSNRITTAVRIGQEAAGQSRPWFKDGSLGLYRHETGGMVLEARVPVGPRFRLRVRSGIIDETSPNERVSHAFVEDLVAVLPTIRRVARTIGATAAGILDPVRAAIDPAYYEVEHVAEDASSIRSLTPAELIARTRFRVSFNTLSATFTNEKQTFEVADADEVRREMGRRLAHQDERSRAYRRALAVGDTFLIDEVAIGLIEANGADVIATLRRMSEVPWLKLGDPRLGPRRLLALVGRNGRVQAHQRLFENEDHGYWYEDRLYVKRRREHARTAVAGAPVAPLVEHSVFSERRIVSVNKEERGLWCIKVDAATLRFDAADGSLRQSRE